MIDADLTYDFEEIPNFVRQLDEGAELVMGNRMENIEPGAMSLTSRIGNPILSGFLNLVYRTPIGDAHCGLRAIRRDALAAARPPLDRDGVRVRDGDPRRPRATSTSASSRSRCTCAAASRSSRRSATAGGTSASCSSTAPASSSSSPAR